MAKRTSRRARGTYVPDPRRSTHECLRHPVTRPVWDLAVRASGDPSWPAEDEDLLVGASLWVCRGCPNYGFSGAWVAAGPS